ncbi:hypothetical protein [Grimontia marina]|uniref:Uncharacterized protein n=1 Tax=Grimontia marina TaxID=646534 RepID=A0A128FBA5_9GAMM|nr:hypothetical protein [Grimontia marina]CZF84093.1 hypothetical protein GMA8713_02951 [Grimontia marina]
MTFSYIPNSNNPYSFRFVSNLRIFDKSHATEKAAGTSVARIKIEASALADTSLGAIDLWCLNITRRVFHFKVQQHCVVVDNKFHSNDEEKRNKE